MGHGYRFVLRFLRPSQHTCTCPFLLRHPFATLHTCANTPLTLLQPSSSAASLLHAHCPNALYGTAVLQPDLCDKLYDVQSYVVVAGASQGRTVPLAPSPEAAAAAAGGGEKGSCVAAAPDVETGMAGRTGVKDGEEGVQSAVEAARMLAEVTGAGAAEATTGGQRPGQQQGEQQQRSGSRGVTVVRHVDAEDFYTFVLNALRL